ncbi:MAG TPA: hypothetical protein VKB75_08345 [Jatrophihabitans sp.]|nr:hypothetical protein [Jatrophihabitans sp.]
MTNPLPLKPTHARGTRIVLVTSALALAAVAAAAYLSRDKPAHQTVLTGVAYVGLQQASVRADGWTYGISASVPWLDANGSLHEVGWPACLSAIGETVPIRFAQISVSGPRSEAWRQVLWVDCRPVTSH